MILLDTTVLVYAVGSDHPLREPSRWVLEAVGDQRVAASTTAQVIQEFAWVRAARRSRDDAVRLASGYLRALAPLAVVEESDVEMGLSLYRAHRKLGTFDAVLAAVAMRTGARALVSADRSFRAVPGLPFVALGSTALETLLAVG